MTDYQVMPPLSAEEYAKLRADIAENGVLVPVVKDHHGNLLDGHHRSQVADELGVKYRVDVVTVRDDAHARSLARMYNLARRHLTREQKRQLIADEVTADPVRSDRAIARVIGCDHKTVGSVRREIAGEIPHPESDSPTELDIAKMIVEIVTARFAEEPKVWAVAVQVADEIMEWAEGPLPNWWYVSRVAFMMHTTNNSLDVWDIVALWLIPVAKLALEECAEFRRKRGSDEAAPGEELIKLTVAIFNDNVDPELRPHLYRSMETRIAIAIVNDGDKMKGAGWSV
jgi:hypothetical protein